MSHRVRLSVVLPAYEEAERIASTVRAVRDEVGKALGDDQLEIVVVDDGSTDATAAVARDAGADQVCVHPRNRGKGAAVRTGVLAARGGVVAFTDADLAYGPDHLLRLLDAIEAGADVAVGNRRHRGTQTVVEARRVRAIGGWVINRLTRLVLQGRYDTQCGLKAFRREAAEQVFSRARIEGFAFDVEVLFLVERLGLEIVEIPVRVVNSSRSSVHVVRDGLLLVRDLFRIWLSARRGGYE